MGGVTTIYFFYNSKLIYIEETERYYNMPFYMEGSKIEKELTQRYYFKDDVLLKWIDNRGKVVDKDRYAKQMKSFNKQIVEYTDLLGVKNGISDKSVRLGHLRLITLKNPTPKNELAYLEAFPSTFDKFYFTFYGDDNSEELYDQHIEHLELLQALANKYPELVLDIWPGVATDGHWDADAVGILQHQCARYAAAETKAFAEALSKRPVIQQQSIIKFLADVENHAAYQDYKTTSENLSRLGYDNLHKEFESAKKRWMAERHY